MCTRVLYTGKDNTVITGRTADWGEDCASNLWAFPAGLSRDGAGGPRSIRWTSKFGSVVVSAYEDITADGINEKGLAANMLYLAESDYGTPDAKRPSISNVAWPQYVLDNYATVAEAVNALSDDPFQVIAPLLPNGRPSMMHFAISDPTSDSAILEYVQGKLTIHHGKQYAVMTNSPIYDQQLALNEYWKGIGGMVFMPGTISAADRFVRSSFFLDGIPKQVDPNYIKGVPQQSFTYQAVASVLSLMRAVSVPLGIHAVDKPNISTTIWRTVSDQKNLVFYFDSATRPNTFWVSLAKLSLKAGAPVRKLTIQNGEVFSGEVAEHFTDANAYKFLGAAA
jgi:penicillin V acylase-like amidase (Ntn superfamily)